MGVGCGVIVTVIRLLGGTAEGVAFSIILMNVATPLIDRWTRPRIYGEVKKNA
jgi:electron transport complex protein RnfD